MRLGAEQQPQPRLVQGVGQLVRAIGRVDVDQDRADLGGGVLHDRPLRAVRRPDADPVALGDARGDQAAGQGVHVGVERGVGPAPPGRHLDQGVAVAVLGDDPLQVGPDGLLEKVGAARALRVGLHARRLVSRPRPAYPSNGGDRPVGLSPRPFGRRRAESGRGDSPSGLDRSSGTGRQRAQGPVVMHDGALRRGAGQASTCALRTTRSCRSEVLRVSLAASTAMIVSTEVTAT